VNQRDTEKIGGPDCWSPPKRPPHFWLWAQKKNFGLQFKKGKKTHLEGKMNSKAKRLIRLYFSAEAEKNEEKGGGGKS